MCLQAALEVEVCLCFYNRSCIDENVKHVEKGQYRGEVFLCKNTPGNSFNN